MFVGETGIGRVVQRTCELMREHQHGRRPPARRHRPGDDPAVPELPLLGLARPVRRRDLDQRRQLLHRRAQGPVRRGEEGRRPSPRRGDVPRHPGRRRADRDAGGAGAAGAQRAPARRLHRGLPARRRPLEPGHPQARDRRRACGCPTGAFTGPSGPSARRASRPDGAIVSQAEWDARRAEWLPTRRRSGVRREPDGPGRRARQVRQLDRAARRAASTGIPSTSSTSGADRCRSARGSEGCGPIAASARRRWPRRPASRRASSPRSSPTSSRPPSTRSGGSPAPSEVPIGAFFEQAPNGQLHLGRRKDYAVVSFDGSTERWEVLAAGLFRGKVRAVVSTLGRRGRERAARARPDRARADEAHVRPRREGRPPVQRRAPPPRGRRLGVPRRRRSAHLGERRVRAPRGRSGSSRARTREARGRAGRRRTALRPARTGPRGAPLHGRARWPDAHDRGGPRRFLHGDALHREPGRRRGGCHRPRRARDEGRGRRSWRGPRPHSCVRPATGGERPAAVVLAGRRRADALRPRHGGGRPRARGARRDAARRPRLPGPAPPARASRSSGPPPPTSPGSSRTVRGGSRSRETCRRSSRSSGCRRTPWPRGRRPRGRPSRIS